MTSILPSVLPLLGAAALFGLATVFRFSFYAGFVERPVSIAIIWGLFTGDWELSLALGVFFELFWMDLIGGGTYLPPNANLPLLFCLFLSAVFRGQGVDIPNPPLVFIMLAIPLAFAGSRSNSWDSCLSVACAVALLCSRTYNVEGPFVSSLP